MCLTFSLAVCFGMVLIILADRARIKTARQHSVLSFDNEMDDKLFCIYICSINTISKCLPHIMILENLKQYKD